MKSIFFIVVTLFSFHIMAQQPQGYTYHSPYEKTVVSEFLETGMASAIDLQLISDPNLSEERASATRAKYHTILNHLSAKKESIKSEMRFLSWLFYRGHRKYLKEYASHSSLALTIHNGQYDCLSATSLYALLLNDLVFNAQVVETNYHIYLKLETQNGFYLFESTDPIHGFVTNPQEINSRLASYRQKDTDETTYQFKTELNSAVSITKLAGLHYYNKAIEDYNNKELMKTLILLEKASIFYHSDRIVEFGWVLAEAIRQDNTLPDIVRTHSLSKISHFLKSREKMALR